MKKSLFLGMLGFLLIIGVDVHALPLWDDSPITLTFDTYTVVNRNLTGVYDATYGGYTGATWSGYYIGTISGNESENALSDIISYYLDALYTVTDFDKVDVPDGATGGSGTDGALTVTWEADRMSGTWSTAGSDSVEFYSAKSSTEYALYYLDPALDDGIWTTEHILNGGGNQAAISHLSATYTGTTPVPEPATMLLLGTGLVGLAGFGRKKFLKR